MINKFIKGKVYVFIDAANWEKYDTAVLMSGDSDFSVPIDRIKRKGKWIIIMSTRGRVSKELLERAKYIDLRKLRGEISQ